MSKKTDHKRLWRNEKKKNLVLSNGIMELRQVIKGQATMLEEIRDGKIKVSEILTHDEIRHKTATINIEANKKATEELRPKSEKVRISPVVRKDRSKQKVI